MSAGRRFGGAYSPGGAKPPPAAPPPRRSLRALLLYLTPTPLLFAALARAFYLDMPGFLALGGCWLALLAAAALTREGVLAHRAYDAHAVARPPAFPRKLFGAALTGLGLGGAAFLGGGAGVFGAGLVGAVAAALHVAAFGPDPMRSKGVNGLEGEALDAAVSRIEMARTLIAEMTRAAARLRDRPVEDKVAAVAREAESVVSMIERDPADLRRARRLLSVYLVGARDATVKYAQTVENGADPEARAAYVALLDDLAGHVSKSRAAIAADERTALDVEIEVLRDRLKLEGV